jgi:hypothetical protein
MLAAKLTSLAGACGARGYCNVLATPPGAQDRRRNWLAQPLPEMC